MLNNTELKKVIESFDVSKFARENRGLEIKKELDIELNELKDELKNLSNNEFVVKYSHFDNNKFAGLLADNYKRDIILYSIRKDDYMFEVYVACGDYNGISFEVFDEDKCLSEMKKVFNKDRYEFYKKLLYYVLDTCSSKKYNSDGLGLDFWEFVNDEIYQINQDDLLLLCSIESSVTYSDFIPLDSSLGYEAQFFVRDCEDGNYISFDVYKMNENNEKEELATHILEDTHTITEALSFLVSDFDEIVSELQTMC